MLDGRHTGTGGGNHFVLGGATPGRLAVLRRPELLTSMIAYWHNHPALSYLFSGLFVGRPGQAPRIDEARNDSVYEIEIAFAEVRRMTERTAVPAVDDRPHAAQPAHRRHRQQYRAEFCIDKLYSPRTAGRHRNCSRCALRDAAHARMSLDL